MDFKQAQISSVSLLVNITILHVSNSWKQHNIIFADICNIFMKCFKPVNA